MDCPKHGSPSKTEVQQTSIMGDLQSPLVSQGTYKGKRVNRDEMSSEEIAEYDYGWENEHDRKGLGIMAIQR